MCNNGFRTRLLILLTAVLCGCVGVRKPSQTVPEPVTAEPVIAEPAVAITTAPTPVEYSVFIEDAAYRLALYEQPKGVYLGAYILSNPAINYDIRQFESLVGKSHALYSYYTSLGGNFPITWFLSCLAQNKTPNITVKTAGLSPDDSVIEKSARELGEFYVPIFVQLAPVDNRYDPEKYKAFFRRAHRIFKEHASNAAIVWTVKAEDVFDCMKYYPGDEYVDWVGVSMYHTITADKDYDPGLGTALDHFYYSFQKTKPIMLTEFAVSHLTSADAVYRNTRAAEQIKRVYADLVRCYPRVKAVTYMDVNGLTAESAREVRDNFSLDGKELIDAYNTATDTGDYLSVIDMRSTGDRSAELMRSPFAAYRLGDELFISRATVENDLGAGAVNRLDVKLIDGLEYFNAAALADAGIGEISADDSSSTVIIKVN